MDEKKKECAGLSSIIKKYASDMVEAAEKEQAGRCAICGSETKLFVDHDHRGSCQFRGLLCRNCNAGLGMLDDSPDNLFRAIEYLRKAEERYERWRTVAVPDIRRVKRWNKRSREYVEEDVAWMG